MEKLLEAACRGVTKKSSPKRERKRRSGSAKPLIGACVARSVGSDEMKANKGALKAQTTEWSKLWEQNVWDNSMYKKNHSVRYEAQRNGREIHLGKLFGICVEKGSVCQPRTKEESTNTG